LRCAFALDAVRAQESLPIARLQARLAAAETQLAAQEAAVQRIESSCHLPLYTATVALTGPVASAEGAAALMPATSALSSFDAQHGAQLAAAAGRLTDEVSAVVTAAAPVRIPSLPFFQIKLFRFLLPNAYYFFCRSPHAPAPGAMQHDHP
jgi:hypothetical protein